MSYIPYTLWYDPDVGMPTYLKVRILYEGKLEDGTVFDKKEKARAPCYKASGGDDIRGCSGHARSGWRGLRHRGTSGP